MKRIHLSLLTAVLAVLTVVGLAMQRPVGAQDDAGENGAGENGRVEIVRRAVRGPGEVLVTAALEAEQDAYIASIENNGRFGAEEALRLGYDSEKGVQRILMRFNLADDLPEEATTIMTATLRLYVEDHAPDLDPPMVVAVQQVTSPWNETIVTWNNGPTIGAVQDETAVNRSDGFYEWDVTSLVGDWAAGRLDNFGLALLGDEDAVAQRLRVITAREGALVFRPRLFVEYLEFDDTQPPVVTVDELSPYQQDDFVVSWSGADVGEAGIDYYDVQYRRDEGGWVDWQTETTETAAVFTLGEVGSRYDFRARGVDKAGNVEAYGEAEATTLFGVQPPVAVMISLDPVTASQTFTVRWALIGTSTVPEVGYRIYYRTPGTSENWQLFTETTDTSALFGPAGDTLYEFEAVALGEGGVNEPQNFTAEASTMVDAVAPFIEPQLYLPLVSRE